MIKLAKPYIPEQAIQKAMEVIKSGNLVQGKYVKEFEEKLKNYLNIKHAVIVSSGTAALHVSLMALNITNGDEVIIPAFAFPAVANVIEIVGAKPVFVDITLDDFCIDTTKIEEKITPRTKAIMPVHEFGQAAKISTIMEIAEKNNLLVIEDAACALGTEFDSQKVGTFGECGCFSFHPRKILTTGEGGLLVTNNDELAGKIISLRNHGITVTNGKYDFLSAGLNYRMTDFQAVLGLYQLSEIEKIIRKRNKIAGFYDDALKDIDWITIPKLFQNRKMVYQTYHILVDHKINRDDLIHYLREVGIETNLGAHAIHCLEYYKRKVNLNKNNFPNSVKAYRRGLALPLGKHITIGKISFIFNNLLNYERNLKK